MKMHFLLLSVVFAVPKSGHFDRSCSQSYREQPSGEIRFSTSAPRPAPHLHSHVLRIRHNPTATSSLPIQSEFDTHDGRNFNRYPVDFVRPVSPHLNRALRRTTQQAMTFDNVQVFHSSSLGDYRLQQHIALGTDKAGELRVRGFGAGHKIRRHYTRRHVDEAFGRRFGTHAVTVIGCRRALGRISRHLTRSALDGRRS